MIPNEEKVVKEMNKFSLFERINSTNESAKRGYLLGQFNFSDGRILIASHETLVNNMGFFLDEIIEFMLESE